MDKAAFSRHAPGKLLKISVAEEHDWAFVPNPLPDKLPFAMDEEILSLWRQATVELGRLDGLGQFMPDYRLLLSPLQKREALRSSSLEGTYATPQQLLLFEIEPREPSSAQDPANSWLEVSNYNRALDAALLKLNERPLSLNLIREIHHNLLSGVRGFHRDPGNFRRSQVHIGSNRRFIPPPPNYVKESLYDLEKYIHKTTKFPLIHSFIVHYQFETIHPFLDGNGRVGRLLLALMIYQLCGLSKPWLYLSAFFDRYKDEYIRLLFDVSTTGNWKDWIAFCLRGTIQQSKDALARFHKLASTRERYMNLLDITGGSIRLSKLITELFKVPAITMPYWVKLSEISPSTARSDFDRLIDNGILTESNIQERPKIFFADEILEIAYGDTDI